MKFVSGEAVTAYNFELAAILAAKVLKSIRKHRYQGGFRN
jgi:hypothetical protein